MSWSGCWEDSRQYMAETGTEQFPKLCFLRICVEEISFSKEMKSVRQDKGVRVVFVTTLQPVPLAVLCAYRTLWQLPEVRSVAQMGWRGKDRPHWQCSDEELSCCAPCFSYTAPSDSSNHPLLTWIQIQPDRSQQGLDCCFFHLCQQALHSVSLLPSLSDFRKVCCNWFFYVLIE